jgi:uracil-DNA glycosylase
MLDDRKIAYLRTMGIELWVRPQLIAPNSTINPTVMRTKKVPISQPISITTMEQLQAQAEKCTACALYRTRNKVVFGVGNTQAEILLVGEAPGADEDTQGLPFVGAAGQLLDKMLYAINLPREQVYIANVVKCRPPENRLPYSAEKTACGQFLHQQIALIQPKIILALGKVAANFLCANQASIGALRQQTREQTIYYADSKIRILATYHPAYLLRSGIQKRAAWQDLQFLWQCNNQN